MLFPYRYVSHSMERMQEYIDFIFYEVWCKAQGNEYDIDILFAGNEELRQIVTELHTSELKGAEFFLTGLQQVFEDFKTLAHDDIVQLKFWYFSNNNIDLLCLNMPCVVPATYKTIATISKDLSKHLKDFFKNLYSKDFLKLKSVSSRIGVIEDHYQAFMTENSSGKCPFCGIQDLDSVFHSKREAYDHFLPKGLYPFNSINFRNLTPACHKCNSNYKLAKDPACHPKNPAFKAGGVRRKAFYPYAEEEYEIELIIDIETRDWTNLTPGDIECSFGPEKLNEEINTWNDVYGIEERYKAKCCLENDGKYWIEQIFDEWQEDGRTPDDFLQTLNRQTNKKPYADNNFLKKAFLDGCLRAGLFD